MINTRVEINSQDNKIRRAFSKAALKYDSLTDLHRRIASELINYVETGKNCSAILDVGMGTGWLTKEMKMKFPNAQVVGLDFADGMIDYAKEHISGIKFVLADARKLPFKKESFDLIVSNLAYQWINDLAQAFQLCHEILKNDGIFSFSLFGEATFCELFDSMDNALISGKREGKKLANKGSNLKALCSVGFRNIKLKKELIKLQFNDMISLIRWIKNIGANRLNNDIYLGKESLLKAASFYQKHFYDNQGVYATFEIISGSCNK